MKQVVLWAVLLTVTSASASGVLVRGPGMAPCKMVLQESWWKDEQPITAITGYILGFTSGIPDLPGTNKDIVQLVKKECESHPSELVYLAIKAVVHKIQGDDKSGKSELKKPPPEEDYSHRPLKNDEEKM
jgi:hypothetical protein